MSTLPSVEVFTKNLPCFNTTLTYFLQAEVGKTRNTLCIWEHGLPPVLPSTPSAGGVSAPNLQLASHQGKTSLSHVSSHCPLLQVP